MSKLISERSLQWILDDEELDERYAGNSSDAAEAVRSLADELVEAREAIRTIVGIKPNGEEPWQIQAAYDYCQGAALTYLAKIAAD